MNTLSPLSFQFGAAMVSRLVQMMKGLQNHLNFGPKSSSRDVARERLQKILDQQRSLAALQEVDFNDLQHSVLHAIQVSPRHLQFFYLKAVAYSATFKSTRRRRI